MDVEDPSTASLTPYWGGQGQGENYFIPNSRPAHAAPMKVVILAGDFQARLVKEIHEELESLRKRPENFGLLPKNTAGSQFSLLRSAEGEEYVASGLIKLGPTTAANNLVAMTQRLERFFPASENIYMVVPEPELQLYHADAKANRMLPTHNIIGNGCKSPKDGVSLLRDLQLAIQHFEITDPVMVMTTDLAFLPDYNFHRVVEHSVIRSKDMCSFVRPNRQTHVIERTHAGCTAPIISHDCGGKSVVKVTEVLDSLGERAPATELMPLFLLRSSSLPLVDEFVTACPGGCIPSFLKFLSTEADLHGIDLEFGAFRLHTLNQVKFAQTVFSTYLEAKLNYKEKLTERHLEDSVQIKWGEAPTRDKAQAPVSWMPAEIEETTRTCMRAFLSKLAGPYIDGSATYVVPEIKESYVFPTYKLPPTFYTTQYKVMTEKASHTEEWKINSATQRSI
mmetsp:Transcript_2435/g.4989  ORF Transcript_2435/g.4989 Transcript_2435/m.4989 type:complete len:451 (-) Transcript_2435:391-1743(-)|eukprot:CAMPEP_0118924536 /NCGR_PEP_ID=MMETSP1169-20130426/2629_1 /TAXON_ID=36882 /ORGANISM="Pyramimonas obovata, Strain CCMP722" /LENGTH=450 /DNA_ID=CAMNT_0006865661 /DNA_START=39 /DNA_END=1391 /DNA_ORIENTATION=+